MDTKELVRTFYVFPKRIDRINDGKLWLSKPMPVPRQNSARLCNQELTSVRWFALTCLNLSHVLNPRAHFQYDHSPLLPPPRSSNSLLKKVLECVVLSAVRNPSSQKAKEKRDSSSLRSSK